MFIDESRVLNSAVRWSRDGSYGGTTCIISTLMMHVWRAYDNPVTPDDISNNDDTVDRQETSMNKNIGKIPYKSSTCRSPPAIYRHREQERNNAGMSAWKSRYVQ